MADLLSIPRETALWAELETAQVAFARARHAEVLGLLALHEQACRTPGIGAASAERHLRLDLAGTMRLGQGRAVGRLRDAIRLRDELPRTLAGLGDGTVWVEQSTALLYGTRNCSPAVTGEVERRVFAAGGQSECPADLARRIAHDILAAEAILEPGATAERQQRARQARSVRSWALGDGMVGQWSTCTAEQAVARDLALDELCRQAKAADEAAGVERTADQRRADVLASLPGRLLMMQAAAAATGAGRVPAGDGAGGDEPLVSFEALIHVPMATALGLSDEPGFLQGYGPLSAAHIRRLLPSARLRKVAVDERTGQPIDLAQRAVAPCGTHETVRDALLDMIDGGTRHPGSSARTAGNHPPGTRGTSGTSGAGDSGSAGSPQTRSTRDRDGGTEPDATDAEERAGEWVVDDTPEPQYRPSTHLSRRIKLRDMRCSGPGCGQSAHRCDDEHLQPHARGGHTSEKNTGPVSRRCHNAKTHDGWTYQRHQDGSCTWTSPTGRSYRRPAFWRPPPTLSATTRLLPPDDPRLIGHASPRGPTPASEGELVRREMNDFPTHGTPRAGARGTPDWNGDAARPRTAEAIEPPF